MIERRFWEEVKGVWIIKAPPKIKEVKTSDGGPIDPELLKEPWETEEIPFDQIDFEGAVMAAFTGEAMPVKEKGDREAPNSEPEQEKKPHLNTEKFDALLEKQTISDYVEACKLLRDCELPQEMDEAYQMLIERMPVLQETIVEFKDVYQPDMDAFYEYYIPEALQLAQTYLEYIDVGIGEEILQEMKKEVVDATDKLLLAINEKIDEIYQFASMEVKAKAKALESMMSQNGYVDPEFKMHVHYEQGK
jgi:hypothetical protein